MFKNILIPVSSEFYSKEALERGKFLAKKLQSKLKIIYIIEEKTLDQTDKLVDSFIPNHGRLETKREIINKQKQTADDIVFEEARFLFKDDISFKEKITKGEFSDVVQNEIKKNNYDLVLMGFNKQCLLNYRLLEEVQIPIWVVTKNKGGSILAVVSNLAPNKKVPKISKKLSQTFKWDLKMLYVVDTEDTVQVDQTGKRSSKKPKRDLLFSAQKYLEKMKKQGIKADIVKGNLEREIEKAAKNQNASLIIIGREQKKKGMLGLPTRNVKKRVIGKCRYSILFLK